MARIFHTLCRKTVTACRVARQNPTQFIHLLCSNGGPVGRALARFIATALNKGSVLPLDGGHRERLIAMIAAEVRAMRDASRTTVENERA